MVADNEGFLQPVVDAAVCIQCGLCEKVCPVLHPSEPRDPLAVYAAKAKDDALRMQSSSGGLFSLLAREVFKLGGIVYGAGWSVDLRVVHHAAENETELSDLRGSKYVQSDMGECYQQAKAHLDKGRTVLFSGTPCQIAGLRSFLQKNYSNLLCVDLICHAVPSPLVFARYKQDMEECYRSKITRISFRRKDCGWKRYSMAFTFANAMEYHQPLDQDPFLRGFLKDLYSRSSCHQCPVRELRSGADITLADYWNVHQRFPELDDDKGVSLVLVNTIVGEQTLSRLLPQIVVQKSDYADVRRWNPAVFRSASSKAKRAVFFRKLAKCQVSRQIEDVLKPTIYRRVRRMVGHCWRYVRRLF